MQLSSVLLVLSLALPFSLPAAARPAYLEVDGIVDPDRDVVDPVPWTGNGDDNAEALQDYNDVIFYLVDERSLAEPNGQFSRSRVHQKRGVKWTYVGCTQDGGARALDYMVRISAATPQKCQAVCEARGNLYSAMQCQCD